MNCPICNSKKIKLEYYGFIRNGKVMSKTSDKIRLFRCNECALIWHDKENENIEQYYESEQYRYELEETADIEDYYLNHDRETLDKLTYTGSTIFRDKIVLDVGCGGGSFIDYISNVAKKVIGIEPSLIYRKGMQKRGYLTYPYMSEAIEEYKEKVDIITSFDVIEHVVNPKEFLREVYLLLKSGGKAIVGTPTETPVMRQTMGKDYERKLLFSTQHLWIFSEDSLKYIANEIGFKSIEIQYKQRYGLDNFISWLQFKEPVQAVNYSFVTESMNELWKRQLEEKRISDYVILKLEK